MEHQTTDGRRPLVFKLAKRKYAIGLLWLTAQKPDEVETEAKQEAREHQADLYVVRSIDGGAQFGLGRKGEGLQAGVISAAGALSEKLKGSVCGVFRIADGWWFFAQRDDLVTPEGDCFYDDEFVARNRLEAEVAEGGWSKIYAPQDWSMGEALDPTEQLMVAKGPRIKSPNAILGYIVPAILVAVLAGGAFFGISQYMAWKEAEQQAAALEETRRQLELEEARRKAAQVILEPWPDLAGPRAVIESCMAGMERLQPDVPGWALAGWSCERDGDTGTSFAWRWTRMFGTTQWLEQWLTKTYAPEVARHTEFDANGDDATTTLSGERLAPRGDEDILDAERVAIDLNSVAQNAGAVLKLGKLKIAVPPEGIDIDDWTPPPFGPIDWSLSVYSMTGWAETLDRFPGLVVDAIEFDPGSSGYVLKGEIYVNR